MNNFPAKFFSIVLHPLMMPCYAALCYYLIFPTVGNITDPVQMRVIMILLFISTVALPIISIFIMLRFGKISSIYMDDQKERNWPLLQTAIVYVGAFYALKTKAVPFFIPLFILGAIATMVTAMLINLRWKISLHMIGIGGLCGGLASLYMILREGSPVFLALVFLFAGILGTSRLALKAHTPLQIVAGFVLGFFAELFLVSLW